VLAKKERGGKFVKSNFFIPGSSEPEMNKDVVI